jgi:hypothetical protein
MQTPFWPLWPDLFSRQAMGQEDFRPKPLKRVKGEITGRMMSWPPVQSPWVEIPLHRPVAGRPDK